MRNIILTTSCFLIILGSFGQTTILGCGVILAVEDEKLCLDFNETDAMKSGTKRESRERQLADRNAKISFSEYSEVSTKNRQTFTMNIDRGKHANF